MRSLCLESANFPSNCQPYPPATCKHALKSHKITIPSTRHSLQTSPRCHVHQAFLHLSSVLSPEDHHLSRCKVEWHWGTGAHAFSGPVARESTCIVNRVVLRFELNPPWENTNGSNSLGNVDMRTGGDFSGVDSAWLEVAAKLAWSWTMITFCSKLLWCPGQVVTLIFSWKSFWQTCMHLEIHFAQLPATPGCRHKASRKSQSQPPGLWGIYNMRIQEKGV